MENSEIKWTGTPDDQTAVVNEYMLRCEQMDKEWWWGCVYLKNEQIAVIGGPDCDKAKTACEKAYREHLKENNHV